MKKSHGTTGGMPRLAAVALLAGLLPLVAQAQTASTATLPSGLHSSLKPSMPDPSLTFSSTAVAITRTMSGGTRTVTVAVRVGRPLPVASGARAMEARTLP